MSVFTVVIIGGSVAGLTLANILERYGIEYVLLEKYNMIAPQLGASLGVLPYGCQILEQLGVNEQVQALGEKVESMEVFGPDGVRLNAQETFGEMLRDLTGYKFSFLDRRELIQVLYDNLQDKSKVHVSKELLEIKQLETGVTVTTTDGTVFTGNVLVGADGVHSQTRREMWRIADSEDPGYGAKQMAKSIVCMYKCMFGIADRPEGTANDRGYKTYHKQRSYLYQTGREGKMYFFAFSKSPEVTIDQEIPRYTAEDQNAMAKTQGNDILFPGLTFGDLYQRRRNAVLVPLQEYVLDKCFYKRAILIGDSFHKMNPLTGQGGNSAIEDAAMLGDLLKEALDRSPQPTNELIRTQFTQFQEERKYRTKLLVDEAHSLQRLEALETPFLEFVALKIVSRQGLDKMAPMLAAMCSPGRILKYLPRPLKEGVVARDGDVIAKPRQRSYSSTAFWTILTLTVACFSVNIGQSPSIEGTAAVSDPMSDYTFVSMMAINGLWMVESHRPGLSAGLLCSPIPYILASAIFGWHVVVPIYFVIYIYLSQSRSFYYPNPRAIDLRAAECLPMGFLTMYFVPILLILKKPATIVVPSWIFPVAHFGLPIFVSIGQKISTKSPPSADIVESLYGTRDMPYLSQFYNLTFFFTSMLHLIVGSRILAYAWDARALKEMTFSVSPGVQSACLVPTIMIWCVFTAWDLRRTNAIQTPLFIVIPSLLLGSVCFGPAAVLIGVWKWREIALERARKRK